MAHLTSAPALRTARVILNNYDLEVRPPETLVSGKIQNLTNSEGHVAVVVDYASNIYQITSLRPEVCFWQNRLMFGTATAPQIANFFKRLLDGFEALPKDTLEEVPTISTFAVPPQHENVKPVTVKLSKPAKEVSRFIFHYYVPTLKGESVVYDDVTHRIKIAFLAEATLGLRRTYEFFPRLKAQLKMLIEGKVTEKDIKICLRAVGIVLEYIPTYEERQEEGKILV